MYRADPTLRVWTSNGGFSGSPSQAGFAFGAGGRRIFWRTETTVEDWPESGPQRSVGGFGTVLALNAEGSLAAARAVDGHLDVRGLSPFRSVASLDPGARVIASAALDSTGGRLAAGSGDGRLQLWDVAAKRMLFEVPAHQRRVTCLRFMAGGRSIASAGEDGCIRIWDAATGKLTSTVTQSASRPWIFDLVPSEKWIMYPAHDGEVPDHNVRVRIQSLVTGSVLRTYPSRDEIGGIAFNAALSGNQYAYVSRSGELQLCDEASGCTILRRQTNEALNSIAFSPDGVTVYTGSETGEVCAWDGNTRGGTFLPAPGGEVRAIVLDPTGERIIAGVGDHVDVWSAFNGLWLARWGTHGGAINAVAAARDGSLYASASNDRTARIWSKDGRPLQTLAGHAGRVNSVAFHPDNATVATASDDYSVRVWDARSGRALRVLLHVEAVSSVRYSPDGAFLLTGSGGERGIRLWAAGSGALVRSYSFVRERSPSPISAVAFSPDGSRVLAARGQDGTIGVWDTRTGRLLTTLPGHSSAPLSLAFSPDGTRLVSGASDRTVRIWDAVSFEQLLVLRGARQAIRTVAFTPDGTRLLSAGDAVRLWPTREGMRWPHRFAPGKP